MSELFEIIHAEPEYYKNGNIKGYCSEIKHNGLNKVVTVRSKHHSDYSRKYDEATELLALEWEAYVKNDNIDIFNRTMENLVKLSNNNGFNESELYIKAKKVEFNEKEPKIPDNIFRLYNSPQNVLNSDDYKANITIFDIIFFPMYFYKKDKMRKINRARNSFKLNYEYYMDCLKEYNDECDLENNKAKKLNDETSRTIKGYEILDPLVTKDYVQKALTFKVKKYMSIGIDFEFNIEYSTEDKTLTVDFDLPGEDIFPKYKDFKLVKTQKKITSKQIKEKELNDLITSTFYNYYIAVLNDLADIDYKHNFENIVLNGYYSGIDKRTGNEFDMCIMSCKVDMDHFRNIKLENIDSKECFKYLKGRGVPNPVNLVQIKPIRFINKEQYKLIDSDNVLSNLNADTNLAAMDWRDFETLIKDVFELEFLSQDIEIRNTQHSNDGGIDVIAFNKNPYSGGIIVLQAKRYTNTVTPEPVRALKGTMQDINAIRGILVTTSNYGKSSYEFAAQNNITLINGDELIQMFDKHGYSFHINIEQAKALNSN